MKPMHHPRLDEVHAATLFYALGDPVRLEILRNLAERGEMNCNGACAALELPKSTLSNHFRILREAGLIHGRKEGTQVVNRLRREEVDVRFPGLLDAVLAQLRPPRRAASRRRA